jgi:phage host-nuclease inhibitor protein Gam
MAKKEEIDIEEEVQRLARKTNVNIKKSEYSYSKQIERLGMEVDKVVNEKIKAFDENKVLAEDYMSIEYKHDTIDRYREKLKKI